VASSADRILTTHVGSLPRPESLLALMETRERGEPVDEAAYKEQVSRAIADVVRKQAECGIDIIGDGENSKISYTFYVRHRLDGIGTAPGGKERPVTAQHADLIAHPDFIEMAARKVVGLNWFERVASPCCVGPVHYANPAPLDQDIANLRQALTKVHAVDGFLNSASPGVLTKFVPNLFYGSEDAYIDALASALSVEYEAIVAAGFILQIDAPDLGSARHNQYQHLSDREFLRIAERNIAALNHATRNIAPDRMRMHICWGNYEGPHDHDIPLATILPVALKARPSGLLFEAANPAHAHEWEDLRTIRIPDDKVLIPGVIDSTTNFVEHPRLVAQRICNFANVVGRDRVLAGTDCGFATFAGPNNPVAPSIVWSKLKAMSEGARIATDRLWG
jgi:5-methyltetrahydropteroyltriglutamate--homocysteine methyltransferase